MQTSAHARTYGQHVAVRVVSLVLRTDCFAFPPFVLQFVLVVPHDEHDYLGVASGGGSRRRAVLMATSRVDRRRGQRRRSARGDAAIGDGE
ncbi:hypothetical protein DFH11DRAFT_1733255 [Phellopilus nigrolimitatus]|nr:hypothetical protein DFH11DRAFT_1733255 [Phellopilus nigrolimitatus]